MLGTVTWTGTFPHFDLFFDDGKVETTPGHPFWCWRRKSWIPACEFRAGDMIRSRKNRPIRVRSVSGIFWKYGSLYNLEIEDNHTYFVGDFGGDSLWAHNSLANGCRVPKAAVVERDPTPAEFEKLAFGRPGKKETFDFPWSEKDTKWGTRRVDDWIEGSGTIQEATTLRWSSLNLDDVHSTDFARFNHKLNQAAQDGWQLAHNNLVKQVIWHGVEPLPTSGRASELTRLLIANGIQYRVVKV